MTAPETKGPSLAEAKAVFDAKLDDGTTCPCCGRFAKRYRRKFNSGMAVSLIALVKLSGDRLIDQASHWTSAVSPLPSPWIHGDEIGRYLGRFSKASYPHGEIGKLVHWKLAEARPNTVGAPKGKTSGYWRPTAAGCDFVRRIDSIPSIVVLWDNVVCGFEGPEVKIDNVMGEHFDYQQLMGSGGG